MDKFRKLVQANLGGDGSGADDNRGFGQPQPVSYQTQDIGPDAWDVVMANLKPSSVTTGALFDIQKNREQGNPPVLSQLPKLNLSDNADLSNLFPNVLEQQQQQASQAAQQQSDAALGDTLKSRFQGALKGHGADFVAVGNKYGVNPTLLAAISNFGTGYGRSDAARNYNNVAGLMDPSSPDAKGFQKFGSVQEGIDAFA